MNIFKLVNSVLSDLYESISGGSEHEKDILVKECLDSLSSNYKNLKNGVSIDYSRPEVRFAYLFKYVTCHSNLVKLSLNYAKMKKIVSEAQLIRICAFGGGPGTEILGSLKYFESIAYNGRLDFTLFDRETAWSDSWSDISEKLDSDRIFSTHLFALDFTQPNNFNAKNYLRSDLFFMIYFFSELNLNDNMEKFLFDTLTNAKQGAKFIYIDNNNTTFFTPVDVFFSTQNVKNILSYEGIIGLDPAEEKRDLGVFYSKFSCPKLDANVAIRIWEKL